MSIEPTIIATAFSLGFLSFLIKLPPMVGFLLAGFVLNAMGYESNSMIEALADIGIILLLFTIGLKLKVSDLLKPEIWGNSILHLLITILFFSSAIITLNWLELPIFHSLNLSSSLFLAFALSFSSTVFILRLEKAFLNIFVKLKSCVNREYYG